MPSPRLSFPFQLSSSLYPIKVDVNPKNTYKKKKNKVIAMLIDFYRDEISTMITS